ncbi:radical SAM protein [Butyrivibrio sp. XBB1001]|uniref:radical SAM protein n=1 Tax=Butyrivibrio sp. XBB1001 TaxID=1280682 RepID=UPI00041FC7E4|nr:radical SAM protein [Butyrivibrio sp. XBB1001]
MANVKDTLLFRFVPTMGCNFRCAYCFLADGEKKYEKTMFDNHSVEEWVNGMEKFSDYYIEPYMWGGEPFSINGTYKVLKEWVKMDHIISGFRIDTNTFFAEKIAKECPSNKIKLNCSYHMPYHTLDEEFRKVKLLKELDMVGMVNFVASKYNLEHLRDDYGMTVMNLIEKFEDIGVFVNIAGDFAYANNPNYEKYQEYQMFIQQFISPDEWMWLRGKKEPSLCSAGMDMFTIGYDGNITSCIDSKSRGNFFEGDIKRDKRRKKCSKLCQSLISYPFRGDNSFPSVNSLIGYVERNKKYREEKQVEYKDFSF